jgi:hypothetical protein
MLGAGIDPRTFVQDYSGFTRAAEIQAQGMQNLGAMIGQGIKDFGEARQERKKIDAEIKATSAGIESAIKMGKDLGIDIGGYLSPIQAKINDPNTSPAEALALGRTAAQGISNAFTLGIGAQERSIASQRARDENAFRLANLEVAQQRANIYGQKAQAEAAKRTEGEISILDPDTGKERKERVWKDQFGNSYDYDTKRPILDTEKYFYGEEGGLGELPPTSQVGGISDSIAKASQLNINQSPSDGAFGFTTKTRDELGKSSIGSRQVSLDFNAAASKDAKGIEIIIPNDATPEERNAANRYVQLTQKFFADRGLNRPIRGVRTAKENGRGTPGRFHTEPFFVGDGEARKIMESDPDGYAQVLANAFNGVQGVTFIAPHKKNDPGASDGKFNERDFAKGSIIPALERLSKGDLSQQTIGTPEQQAEVGLMIEQSAGMRTAQAAPSGAMPTEPRINQQPQPAPRRMVRGIPVGGGTEQGTIMTQQQVNELEASGRQVSAVPTPDGNFRVTSVRTGTPQMGFEMTYDEQGRPILKQSATGVGAAPKVGEGQILSTDASGRPSIVNIPGGKADIETQKAAQAAENERKFELDRAGIVLSEIDKLIGYAGEMSRLPGASTYRKFAPMAGFEGASEVENTLDTVKAGFRFETLQRLKEASPTGSSGLGAVTKPEFDALAEEKGKLTQVGDPRELQRRATNYKKMVLDTIHGSKQDRDKLLKEGKITKESYDAVESLYPGFQKKQPLAPEVMEIRKRLLGE